MPSTRIGEVLRGWIRGRGVCGRSSGCARRTHTASALRGWRAVCREMIADLRRPFGVGQPAGALCGDLRLPRRHQGRADAQRREMRELVVRFLTAIFRRTTYTAGRAWCSFLPKEELERRFRRGTSPTPRPHPRFVGPTGVGKTAVALRSPPWPLRSSRRTPDSSTAGSTSAPPSLSGETGPRSPPGWI